MESHTPKSMLEVQNQAAGVFSSSYMKSKVQNKKNKQEEKEDFETLEIELILPLS